MLVDTVIAPDNVPATFPGVYISGGDIDSFTTGSRSLDIGFWGEGQVFASGGGYGYYGGGGGFRGIGEIEAWEADAVKGYVDTDYMAIRFNAEKCPPIIINTPTIPTTGYY